MKTVWANNLVRNEERYLWYAVTSIIDYVDKVLIWDTGSSDNTPKIINLLKRKYKDKIEVNNYGEVTPDTFTKARQDMLENTKSDWLLVLDGDEVWWEDSIKKVVRTINTEGDKLESIVNRYTNLVGDIYHYQSPTAGRYKIDETVGNISIRAINLKIPGLHLEKPHGQIGYYDKKGKLIQDRDVGKRKHLDVEYLHFTHLPRSINIDNDRSVPKREKKLKHELGLNFPSDFYYPEAFFYKRPSVIPSPWERMSKEFHTKSAVQTPLRAVKRKLITNEKVGY
ncbi:glycosyltransferase [Patescibacteria group bacterium]